MFTYKGNRKGKKGHEAQERNERQRTMPRMFFFVVTEGRMSAVTGEENQQENQQGEWNQDRKQYDEWYDVDWTWDESDWNS